MFPFGRDRIPELISKPEPRACYTFFMKAIIGAHISAAGGYVKAVERVVAIGGNALQLFSTSPRGWGTAKISPEDAEAFRVARKKAGIDPVYFHASYLINLSDPGRVGTLSKKALITELTAAGKMQVRGSIVHLGSFKDGDGGKVGAHKNYPVLIKNIYEVLAKTPKETLFIIENAGNRKIGRRFEEIGKIIGDVGDSRLKVCLDTCHLHAAGYDLRTEEALHTLLKRFDELIGPARLECIHVNDSRDAAGSLRDRHENIGSGEVGEEVFRLLFRNPKTRSIPFITEVPGYDGLGPDKKNIDRLKALAFP
ncbi:MAG: deoxyribonuclease IV [Parcubacteria group bacterium Gr01-1014_72]|nr:MAG: deoxyribonuclease IV [Parcubacteria group bacterium Gr01-1014_72]